MKDIYYRKSSIISIVAIMFTVSFIITGCEKEEDKPLDEVILNSPELEEYIIAGADFQQSLAIFKKELNKVNFSKLEATYDENGRKVVHLPSACSVSIEQKVQVFNEKKEALNRKFPQFSSFSEKTGTDYFQQCVQNSVKVNSEFLKLGINTSRSRLKSNPEINGEDMAYLNWQMYNWYNNPNYVEVFIIIYANGTYDTYFDPRNTVENCFSPVMYYNNTNGNVYHNGNIVAGVAHTHQDSSSPSNPDGQYPHVPNYIYYHSSFNCYYNCD